MLAHADLLAHPSLSEGFGFAIIEAMAAGLPVVATRSGGPQEIVRDGAEGLLVDVGRADELAAAMGSLLADPDRAKAMGRAGQERVGAFSLQTTARRTQGVYDRVAGEAGGRAATEVARRQLLADELLTEIPARAAEIA